MIKKWTVVFLTFIILSSWTYPASADTSTWRQGNTIAKNGTLELQTGNPMSLSLACVDVADATHDLTSGDWVDGSPPELPTGLEFNQDQTTISGAATVTGTYLITTRWCMDGTSLSNVAGFTIHVTSPPIDTSSAFNDTSGNGHATGSFETFDIYNYRQLSYLCINTTDGDPFAPVTSLGWVSDPVLPAGMTFDSNSMEISGAPTEAGLYNLPNILCEETVEGNRVQQEIAVGSILVMDQSVNPSSPFTNTTGNGHNGNSDETLTINNYASLDYSCTNTTPGDPYGPTTSLGWVSDPVLPPGMSFNVDTMTITGTPTSLGTFALPQITCEQTFQGQRLTHNIDIGSLTVHEASPNVSGNGIPAPIITVTNLNSPTCEFRVTAMFPRNSDEWSTNLTITDGENSVTGIFGGYKTLQLFDAILPMGQLNSALQSRVDYRAGSQSGSLTCGEKITVSMKYQNNGVDSDVASETNFQTSKSIGVFQASASTSESCEILLSGTPAFTPDNNTVIFHVEGPDGSVETSFDHVSSGQNIVSDLNYRSGGSFWNTIENPDRHIYSTGTTSCSDSVTASFSYLYKGTLVSQAVTHFLANAFNGSSSPGGVPEFSVTPLNDSQCEILVTLKMNLVADPWSIEIKFQDPDIPFVWEAIQLRTPSANQTIKMKLRANDIHQSAEDYEFYDDWTAGEDAPGCGSTLKAQLTYSVNDVWADPVTTDSFVPRWLASTIEIRKWQHGSCLYKFSSYLLDTPTDGVITLRVYYGGDFGTFLSVPISDLKMGDEFFMVLDLEHGSLVHNYYAGTVGDITPIGSETCESSVGAEFYYELNGAGTWSNWTEIDIPAASVCGKGTYSATGFGPCTDAEQGKFVPAVGATVATPCPPGMTTEGVAASSIWECFKPLIQTIKTLKPPKALKFVKSVVIPGQTDQGLTLTGVASGSCTLTATMTKGKHTYKVVTSKLPGVCSITLSTPAIARNAALTKSFSIKVNKKGK